MSGLDNLAWARLQCNIAKGTDAASCDPGTGELSLLYDPRTQTWEEHFSMTDGIITGKTPIGRVKVDVLQLTSREQVAIRVSLIEIGRW